MIDWYYWPNEHPLSKNKIDIYVYELCALRLCACVFIYICTNWLKTINKPISHSIRPHFFNGLLVGTCICSVRTVIKRSPTTICEENQNTWNNFTQNQKIPMSRQNVLLESKYSLWLGPQHSSKICHHTLKLPLKERTKRNVNWNRNTIPDMAAIIAFYFLIILKIYSVLLCFHWQSWPNHRKIQHQGALESNAII